jgi:hypothetical protein
MHPHLCAGIALFFVGSTALTAAPVGANRLPKTFDDIVQRAGESRCEAWKEKCAWRWGLGTWRYERCLARHGC